MAQYSIRDAFGRFAKLIGGQPEQRPPPIRDALGHYVSRPIEPPAPEPPRIPFIDDRTRRQREFDDYGERALEIIDYLDKPDINDYLYDYDSEWLSIWAAAPVEDMSQGQIWAMIDVIDSLDDESWDQVWAEIMEDYWEWFREHYGKD